VVAPLSQQESRRLSKTSETILSGNDDPVTKYSGGEYREMENGIERAVNPHHGPGFKVPSDDLRQQI